MSNVVGFPQREPERFVDAKELSGIMGVSVKTIYRMHDNGMPGVTWGRRLLRFQPSVAIQWANAQKRDDAA